MNLKGSLKLLSEKNLEDIHTSTLEILEKVGVRFTVPETRKIFTKAGFKKEKVSLILSSSSTPPSLLEEERTKEVNRIVAEILKREGVSKTIWQEGSL